jgi:NitT/TauT family transport system permease protein
MKQLWSISMKLLNSNIVRPLILVVGLLVGWELAIKIFAIKPYLIPEPLAVIQQMISEWPHLWRETLVTTYAALGGFALSIVFGIPIAMLFAYC